jgi:uncharacterized protein with PIN domain
MKLYECQEHDQEWSPNADHCVQCRNILKRIEENEKALIGHVKQKFHGAEVYWPGSKKGGVHGRVIENLGHTPQRFNTKTAFREFLKRNRVQEAG